MELFRDTRAFLIRPAPACQAGCRRCKSSPHCDSILRQNMSCADISLAATFLIARQRCAPLRPTWTLALCSRKSRPPSARQDLECRGRRNRRTDRRGDEPAHGDSVQGGFSRLDARAMGDHRRQSHSVGLRRRRPLDVRRARNRLPEPYLLSSSAASPSRSQLPSFGGLLDNLLSVNLAGTDHIAFEGVPTNCEILHAEYWIPAARGAGTTAGTTIIRTACVDRARKLILRDHTESWPLPAPTHAPPEPSPSFPIRETSRSRTKLLRLTFRPAPSSIRVRSLRREIRARSTEFIVSAGAYPAHNYFKWSNQPQPMKRGNPQFQGSSLYRS